MPVIGAGGGSPPPGCENAGLDTVINTIAIRKIFKIMGLILNKFPVNYVAAIHNLYNVKATL